MPLSPPIQLCTSGGASPDLEGRHHRLPIVDTSSSQNAFNPPPFLFLILIHAPVRKSSTYSISVNVNQKRDSTSTAQLLIPPAPQRTLTLPPLRHSPLSQNRVQTHLSSPPLKPTPPNQKKTTQKISPHNPHSSKNHQQKKINTKPRRKRGGGEGVVSHISKRQQSIHLDQLLKVKIQQKRHKVGQFAPLPHAVG